MAEKKEEKNTYETWNCYKKLSKARVLLQQRKLKKSGFNKFSGFYYFELSDFLPAVNEIFAELGLCATFRIDNAYVEETDSGQIVENPSKAYLGIINTDNTDDRIWFSSEIAEAGTKGASPIQQLGSVHTYMRRYLYMEALEIVEADGLDALNGTDKIEQKAVKKQAVTVKPVPCTKNQISRMTELFGNDTERLEAMMNVYGIKALSELTEKQAEAVIARMEGQHDRKV